MSKKRRTAHRAHLAGKPVRIDKMYPVYARKVLHPEVVLGEEPLYYIDAKTRAEWLEQGAVASHCRGQMVRLLLNLPPKVQQSVAMTAGVVEGAAEKKPYALACAMAWSGRERPYCNYPRVAA